MSIQDSGAGYGNHGGDGSMGGQDGSKSGDHVPGEGGTTSSDATNKGVDPSRDIPDDAGKGDYEDQDEDQKKG